MDQQGESSHFFFKRHQLQDKTFDARPEDDDASFKSRLLSSIQYFPLLCWIIYFLILIPLLYFAITRFLFLLDTKMDRKDKLFVVNEVSLLIQQMRKILCINVIFSVGWVNILIVHRSVKSKTATSAYSLRPKRNRTSICGENLIFVSNKNANLV